MKTKFNNSLASLILTILLILVINPIITKAGQIEISTTAEEDTLNYTEYSGKLLDASSGDEVIFANVFIDGTSIGTVTNSDGEFTLKVPDNHLNKKICFAHIGYETKKLTLDEFKNRNNEAVISPQTKSIEEVVVRTSDPQKLLRMALVNIADNYPQEPSIQRAFYRETIKENRRYVAILEAVADIYKSPYSTSFDYDRVKIFKGRKSRDVKRMDTVLFKLQGGPVTSLLIDVAKHPQLLFSADKLDFYNYKLEGIAKIDDKLNYIINFKLKKGYTDPMYSGKIYIDYDKLAISTIEFHVDEQSLETATSVFVRKKPFTMDVETMGANYLATYREIDGKWYLSYIRAESSYKVDWDKKLFNSRYYIMTEMAITDRNTEKVEKFKRRESFKSNEILAEEVEYFEDENFWGKENTIKPDEDIQTAIRRLKRKMD